MKKIIALLIILLLSVLPVYAQKYGTGTYSTNIGAVYHWNQMRKGICFQSNFNVNRNSRVFQTFIGFDLGISSRKYQNDLTQSEINSIAIANMEGYNLVDAHIDSDASPESTFMGGLNLSQWMFLNNRTVPFVGLGINYKRFPKLEYKVDHQSNDDSYMYYDSTPTLVADAFWRLGFDLYLHLATSKIVFHYGYCPNAGNGIHSIGLHFAIIDNAFGTI